MTLSTNALLRVAAFVLFVIAAVLALTTNSTDLNTLLGLTDTGLACWVLSTVIP